MPVLRSTPTTRPVPASRSATVLATIPVSQATSSTDWPGASPATSASSGAHSAKIAGTNLASYCSATSSETWKSSVAVMTHSLHGPVWTPPTLPSGGRVDMGAGTRFRTRSGRTTEHRGGHVGGTLDAWQQRVGACRTMN